MKKVVYVGLIACTVIFASCKKEVENQPMPTKYNQGYQVYYGLISQKDFDDPTGITLEGSDFTPTFDRIGDSDYRIISEGKFKEGKTWVICNLNPNYNIQRYNDDQLIFTAPGDNSTHNLPIEIRIHN